MRSVLLVLGLVLAGCGESAESCDVDAATRCFEEAAETCTDGAWTITDDCGANGMMCMQNDAMREGEAHCM